MNTSQSDSVQDKTVLTQRQDAPWFVQPNTRAGSCKRRLLTHVDYILKKKQSIKKETPWWLLCPLPPDLIWWLCDEKARSSCPNSGWLRIQPQLLFGCAGSGFNRKQEQIQLRVADSERKWAKQIPFRKRSQTLRYFGISFEAVFQHHSRICVHLTENLLTPQLVENSFPQTRLKSNCSRFHLTPRNCKCLATCQESLAEVINASW